MQKVIDSFTLTTRHRKPEIRMLPLPSRPKAPRRIGPIC